jgi:hypothetical protein
MVIRVFVFLLLIFSVISYFIPVESKNKKDSNKDIPLLSFKDSTMYTLTPESMNRIIYSKQTMRYSNRDVMHEGALTLQGKDKDQKDVNEVLYADLIVKRGDIFRFLSNVKYRKDDYIKLNTDELIYNSKTKIATNSLPFDGYYFNDYIKGKNIYLDMNRYYMKAKDSHFEIDMNN